MGTVKQYNESFSKLYGTDTTAWPLMILMEAPLSVSERVPHIATLNTMRANELIREIFVDNWYIFPLQNISQSRQFSNDGLHPTTDTQIDINRVLVQLIYNTLK